VNLSRPISFTNSIEIASCRHGVLGTLAIIIEEVKVSTDSSFTVTQTTEKLFVALSLNNHLVLEP
jgi:hypothetical protein